MFYSVFNVCIFDSGSFGPPQIEHEPFRRDSYSLVVRRLLLIVLLSEVFLHTLFLKLMQTLQLICIQHQL